MDAIMISEEVGEILRVHPRVIERWARRGEFPGFKVGRFWRYRRSSLDAWIDKKLSISSVDTGAGPELHNQSSPVLHGDFNLQEASCRDVIDSGV